MSEEELIIVVYCLVDEIHKNILGGTKLRRRGPLPKLSDPEILTILIVGEYLGLGSDQKIWSYFKRHWGDWFPGLGSRTTFVRQAANLQGVVNKMQHLISEKLCQNKNIFLFDGFPIPVCHIKRYKRSSPFKGLGSVGYCAAKDEKFFGFKGHILISPQGATKAISIAPANIDERDILPEVSCGVTGDIIADKGLIRPELTQELACRGITLNTPLRKNMKDTRPKKFLSKLMNIRRIVETVISQLVDRFGIQKIRAQDTWHLHVKIARKILAHTVSFFINQSLNPDAPLQLEKLLNLP